MNRNPGLYFVTICTKDRQHHFGEIRDGIMGLSVPGCVAWHYWRQIPNHQPNVVLDEFVVMPNHLHGIVGITPDHVDHARVGICHGMSPQNGMSPQKEDHTTDQQNQVQFGKPQSQSLSMIINHYKGSLTWCNANGHEYFAWQSRFYDHIIRNEKALHRIRKYILNNPLRWQIDRENPNSNEIHEQAVEYMAANL
ncbi:transposase [Halalkalibaculum sp. DA3122]|uniref:transposase n=1 Tax=Halalkalibaculum sp. DA3122 TaxID=3373607 RepID=UPI00375433C9